MESLQRIFVRVANNGLAREPSVKSGGQQAAGAVHAVAASDSDRGRHSAVAARYVVRADDLSSVADHAILAFCSMCKSHTMSIRQNALHLEQCAV